MLAESLVTFGAKMGSDEISIESREGIKHVSAVASFRRGHQPLRSSCIDRIVAERHAKT